MRMIPASDLRTALSGIDPGDEPALRRIAGASTERHYAPRDILYRAGDRPTGLFFVLSGKVLVVRETASRAEMLHTETAGGVLGEIPVFGGGAFPATATAVETTRCAHLSIDAVDRLLREEPSFARFAIRRLATRAQSLLRRIDDITATTVTARLAAYIAARAETSGGEFTLGMSQEKLSAELGTAREVVVRGLAALVSAGAIVRTGRSRFAIGKRGVLASLAGSNATKR